MIFYVSDPSETYTVKRSGYPVELAHIGAFDSLHLTVNLTDDFKVELTLLDFGLGAFAEKTLGRFGAWLVLMLPALLLRGLFTVSLAMIRGGIPTFLPFLREVLLPEAWTTLLFGIPLYFVCSLCMLLLKDRRERSPR